VADRTAQLEASNKELEAFSYSVSHDLRAPLRSIDGFSQALEKDYGGILDDNGKDFLRRVRAASQTMARLIDDLLKLSQLTRTEIRRESVNLSMVAREIAEELQKTQPARRVEFIIADGLIGYGDPQLLRVGMENLLGNAWKYTRKNLAARIEFGATRQDGGTAYYVRDNGVGFDMAYADKLFGAFQRLHSTAEFEGTGIGLATVQRIIRRHGGRVWTEAKINEGATFYFSL
jgi:light-regulated signal transduction histidine kinase (bacteriophytochrome)